MSNVDSYPRARARLRFLGLAGLIAALSLSLALPGMADAKKKKKPPVNTMTRNLYLGADLTPGLTAANIPQFVKAAGDIWLQVQRTNFPARAVSLAAEIRSQNADIVGLQEAAKWQIQVPPDGSPPPYGTGTPAGTVAYDFINSLLDELNRKAKSKKQCNKAAKGSASAAKSKKCYRGYQLLVSRDEFDFEAPANDTGVVNNTPPAFGATKDIRLTMRDAIIAKVGAVKSFNPQGGTFSTLSRFPLPAPLPPITVNRGWVSVDAKVSKSSKKASASKKKSKGTLFHFVNTHLEAFDSQPNNLSTAGIKPKGGVRQAQAQELLAGPLRSTLPTLLVGDINSDTPLQGNQQPGDDLAQLALIAGGFSERALTPPPFSCCISDPNLANPSTAGITHRVDHIMSNNPAVTFRGGAITSTYANGLWSSDHFGVASSLGGL